MTPPCPRCGAPLHGPVCASCGTRFEIAPPGQYPAPPSSPYPPLPPPYGPPPVHAPPRPPRVTGAAVFNIVLFSLYLLFALLGIAGASEQQGADDRQGAVIGGVVILIFGAAGLTMSVYLIKGRWWGGLVAGVLQAILGLLYLLALVGVLAAKDELHAEGGSVSAAVTVLVIIDAISWAAMIFAFVAMARLKDGGRVHPATAAQHF